MTAKSVLVRPQGLRPRTRVPLALPCYTTAFRLVPMFRQRIAASSEQNDYLSFLFCLQLNVLPWRSQVVWTGETLALA